MYVLKQVADTYFSVHLDSAESRHNEAKAIHDQLEVLLATNYGRDTPRRSFFDPEIKEEKKEPLSDVFSEENKDPEGAVVDKKD